MKKYPKRIKYVLLCCFGVIAIMGILLLIFSDLTYHPSPMYEVESYEALSRAMDKADKTCILIPEEALEGPCEYIVLLKDRFHNKPVGYGINNSDYTAGVGCQLRDAEQITPTDTYMGVEISVDENEDSCYIQFILDGYIYTVHGKDRLRATDLAKGIIDQK